MEAVPEGAKTILLLGSWRDESITPAVGDRQINTQALVTPVPVKTAVVSRFDD
jgi:hypothetical protein